MRQTHGEFARFARAAGGARGGRGDRAGRRALALGRTAAMSRLVLGGAGFVAAIAMIFREIPVAVTPPNGSPKSLTAPTPRSRHLPQRRQGDLRRSRRHRAEGVGHSPLSNAERKRLEATVFWVVTAYRGKQSRPNRRAFPTQTASWTVDTGRSPRSKTAALPTFASAGLNGPRADKPGFRCRLTKVGYRA